ncbi:MAG TPA: hypothetical protein DGB72_02790 [Gemmatimonadetes bacterium]|jgi:hypothetical protein|nr:hypothetical protein [Gemmatimonadota bacterium]
MENSTERLLFRRALPALGMLAVLVLLAVSWSSGLGGSFLASLRIAKPKAVAPGISAPSATNGGQQIQALIGSMVGETTSVALNEADKPVPSADSASRLAGFTARLLGMRSDAPSITVIGAHAMNVKVNRAQIETMLAEAGRRNAQVPGSIDGTILRTQTPRAIRVQYGNCPAPVANTIQNQINGPPPPSTDNANCVIFTQTPVTSTVVPPGLNIGELATIALELSGMSPNQTHDFQRAFDLKSTLSMSLPRGIRSYDAVQINARPAMLIITGGRRGPTYQLMWASGGTVFTLAGYGSSADAVPLASSAR